MLLFRARPKAESRNLINMKQKPLTYFVSDVHLGLQVADPAGREARFVSFLRGIPAEETEAEQERRDWHEKPWVTISLVIFIGLNFVLGIFSQPVVELITRGLRMFG